MENLATEIQIIANSLYNSRTPQFLPPVQRGRSLTANLNNGVKSRSKGKRPGRESGLNVNFVTRDLMDNLRGRSSSASSSKSSTSSSLKSDFCSQNNRFGDSSFSISGIGNCVIPELSESPYLGSSTSHSYCSAPSSQDSSNTSPFAEEVTPSPSSSQWLLQQEYYSLVTSTPNIQYCGIDATTDNYYTLPSKKNAARAYMFSSDNIAEEKAFVVRRSSLTGQLEQFQKPYDRKSTGTAMTGFKVLNKGVRKSFKRRSSRLDQIILPGVETTV